MQWKISAGLWVFGGALDRFCSKGYGPLLSTEEAIAKAGQVDGLEGIEPHYPSQVNEENLDSMKKALKENNLHVTTVSLDTWSSAEWKHGAFTSGDENIRKKAIQLGKNATGIANELNCKNIGIWPGQDGFDYPFQADYEDLWRREVEGIKEVAGHDREMKVAVEYKLKEPRTHMLIGSVGKALLLINEINLDNLGIVLDSGHALMSKENLGESVVLLSRHNKLFNVHLNDNYREWDDDMVVGTINFWETLELLYYLKKVDYKGTITLDQFPFREDSVKAAGLSIKNIKTLVGILEKIDFEKMEEAQRNLNAMETQELLRKIIFEK
jgi:xylose isomerase